MTDSCPSDDALALHVDGRLSPSERAEVASHLAGCDDCRRLVGALAAARTRSHATQDAEVFATSTWRWEPGHRIGRYALEGPLGRGGMGEVYEALDIELRRLVAIKVARPGPEDQARSERVVAEGRTLASLDHPNVVRVFDAGTHDDAAYIVIERAEGSSLRRWLAGSPRHVRDVLRLFRGVAQGCAAIHGAGLVHRDIKPDNILIDPSGRARVTDFGLAKSLPGSPAAGLTGFTARLTATGTTLGTVGYMSAEQLLGTELTPATDQFALAVTAFEALYGAPPFGGSTADAVAIAIVDGRVTQPARERITDPRIHAVIERALAPEAADRHGSMAAFSAALRGQAVTSAGRSWWSKIRRRR